MKGLLFALNGSEEGGVGAGVTFPAVAGKGAGDSGECGVDEGVADRVIPTEGNFSFNSSYFLQTNRVAMGTYMGPSYACLFIGYVEQYLFYCYTDTIPHLFLLCNDDCIGIALCSHEELEHYLDYTSSHPASCKNAIPYSQFLCLRCICSQDRAFHFWTSQMSSYFKDRNFPPPNTCALYMTNDNNLLITNHFNSPSHSLGDVSVLGLLQCHNDTTCKLEEQHLIF
eukprot:g24948.t1